MWDEAQMPRRVVQAEPLVALEPPEPRAVSVAGQVLEQAFEPGFAVFVLAAESVFELAVESVSALAAAPVFGLAVAPVSGFCARAVVARARVEPLSGTT